MRGRCFSCATRVVIVAHDHPRRRPLPPGIAPVGTEILMVTRGVQRGVHRRHSFRKLRAPFAGEGPNPWRKFTGFPARHQRKTRPHRDTGLRRRPECHDGQIRSALIDSGTRFARPGHARGLRPDDHPRRRPTSSAGSQVGGFGRRARGGEGVQVLGSGHRSRLFIVTRATGLDRSISSVATSIQDYIF